MIIEFKPFYKTIIIEIGMFESKIADERHFKTMEEAVSFVKSIKAKCENISCIIIQIGQ